MTSKSQPPVALIAGPTASGKSALAMLVAEQVGGVIVNADSAQVYRDIPTLSSMPSLAELTRAEHRLYGVIDGAEACSAARWAQLAKREIAEVHLSGRLPILVGGTGLYLRTLLEGIAPVPPIDPGVRREVREGSRDANWDRLLKLDPEGAARLNPRDTGRLARALEVVLSTGKTLGEWQHHREGGIAGTIDLRPLILLPPRAWLYRRCDERFFGMVDEGAAREVEALLARNLSPRLPLMQAIGVRELAAWIEGSVTREEAIMAGQQATRRYAKRQYTWFRHQPPADWPRFTEPLEATSMSRALALLQSTP